MWVVNPQTGVVLQVHALDICSFLIVSVFYKFVFGSVSVDTGSIRRYLDHVEVLQVIHSFRMTHGVHGGQKVCCVWPGLLTLASLWGVVCYVGVGPMLFAMLR